MESGRPLYLAEDARAIDAAAAALDGLSGHELMHRAGATAFDALRTRWPAARRIAVCCGTGNNGGDGYVLARLARDAGLEARVFALGAPHAARVEAVQAGAAWRAGGAEVPPVDADALRDVDVVVDALVGTGLQEAPRGAASDAIGAISASDAPVLSLDVPSGLDADRGSAPGAVVRAVATVTFVADKRGLHTGRGRAVCGELTYCSLGVTAATRARRAPSARLLLPRDLAAWLPRRARDAHKGQAGHVLAIGGELGTAGAIVLCARAALRAGAGLVSVATRAEHALAALGAAPEAMWRGVEDASALQTLAARATVVALGPGLGQGDWGRRSFEAALALPLPRVLDADALNLLARAPRPLPGDVLTPHPGEAARLLDCDVAGIEVDRYAAAQALATRYDAVVVLKGAGTVVAAPGRVPAVIGAGNPGMASGGMGDVLTGVIAALRAQGLAPFDAACAGALLHAAAGDAAAGGGERGLLASDVIEALRRAGNPS